MKWEEQRFRRPGWDERSAVDTIRLADGQTWLFAKPVCGERVVSRGWMPSMPRAADPQYDAILRRLDDQETKCLALFEAAVYLLRVVYDLPDDAYSDLLLWDRHDEENQWMWRCIVDVASGRGDESIDLWFRAAAIQAVGPRGPLLMEEVSAAVVMQVRAGKLLAANKYVYDMIREEEDAKWQALLSGV